MLPPLIADASHATLELPVATKQLCPGHVLEQAYATAPAVQTLPHKIQQLLATYAASSMPPIVEEGCKQHSE